MQSVVFVMGSIIAVLWALTVNAGDLSDRGLADPVITPPPGACYPVISERTGEVLYWTGSPASGKCVSVVVDGDTNVATVVDVPDVRDPDDDDDHGDDDRDDDQGKGKDKSEKKGNASANNGKGGNYDKTGHSDNGKGEGRNKK